MAPLNELQRAVATGLLILAACGNPRDALLDRLPVETALTFDDVRELIRQSRWDAHTAHEQTLGAVLNDSYQAEEFEGDYEWRGAGEVKPEAIVERVEEMLDSGKPLPIMARDHVRAFECRATDNTARGTAEIVVPDRYRLNLAYRAQLTPDGWRFIEFSLERSGVSVKRDIGGRWRAFGLKPVRPNLEAAPNDIIIQIPAQDRVEVYGRRFTADEVASLLGRRRELRWPFAVRLYCALDLPFECARRMVEIGREAGVASFELGCIDRRDVVRLPMGPEKTLAPLGAICRLDGQFAVVGSETYLFHGDARGLYEWFETAFSGSEPQEGVAGLKIGDDIPCEVVRRLLLSAERHGRSIEIF